MLNDNTLDDYNIINSNNLVKLKYNKSSIMDRIAPCKSKKQSQFTCCMLYLFNIISNDNIKYRYIMQYRGNNSCILVFNCNSTYYYRS